MMMTCLTPMENWRLFFSFKEPESEKVKINCKKNIYIKQENFERKKFL